MGNMKQWCTLSIELFKPGLDQKLRAIHSKNRFTEVKTHRIINNLGRLALVKVLGKVSNPLKQIMKKWGKILKVTTKQQEGQYKLKQTMSKYAMMLRKMKTLKKLSRLKRYDSLLLTSHKNYFQTWADMKIWKYIIINFSLNEYKL